VSVSWIVLIIKIGEDQDLIFIGKLVLLISDTVTVWFHYKMAQASSDQRWNFSSDHVNNKCYHCTGVFGVELGLSKTSVR
jgi:hypothetical protein